MNNIKSRVAYGIAARIGIFLYHKGVEPWGTWSGKLTKAEQMDAFGLYMGKGQLHIDGQNETIVMTASVSFGTMRDTVRMIDCKVKTWFDNVADSNLGNQLENWKDEDEE